MMTAIEDVETESLKIKEIEIGKNKRNKKHEKNEKDKKNDESELETTKTPTPETAETPSLLQTDIRTWTTEVTLTLHTASAYAVFTGEWAPGKLGLRQFGKSLQAVWQGFEQEDPYAEWTLLKIYSALQELKTQMQTQEDVLRQQIRSLRGLQLKIVRNGKPFTASLISVNLLLLKGAELIAQLDFLTRELLTLKQLGIVASGQARSQEFREDMQRIYVLAASWHRTDITREDILEDNHKSQQAKKEFGTLPEEILFQTTTLPFLNIEA
jgi:integrating conjugative element protein (TIGR03761 family)